MKEQEKTHDPIKDGEMTAEIALAMMLGMTLEELESFKGKETQNTSLCIESEKGSHCQDFGIVIKNLQAILNQTKDQSVIERFDPNKHTPDMTAIGFAIFTKNREVPEMLVISKESDGSMFGFGGGRPLYGDTKTKSKDYEALRERAKEYWSKNNQEYCYIEDFPYDSVSNNIQDIVVQKDGKVIRLVHFLRVIKEKSFLKEFPDNTQHKWLSSETIYTQLDLLPNVKYIFHRGTQK